MSETTNLKYVLSGRNEASPDIMSRTRPGFLIEWKYIMSPRLPSVRAGEKTGMLFFQAQYAMQLGSLEASPKRAMTREGVHKMPYEGKNVCMI